MRGHSKYSSYSVSLAQSIPILMAKETQQVKLKPMVRLPAEEAIHILSFFTFQSEKAGHISRHQLLIAVKLNNPVLMAQCKVFMAMSLVQRGQLKAAIKIIRYGRYTGTPLTMQNVFLAYFMECTSIGRGECAHHPPAKDFG